MTARYNWNVNYMMFQCFTIGLFSKSPRIVNVFVMPALARPASNLEKSREIINIIKVSERSGNFAKMVREI